MFSSCPPLAVNPDDLLKDPVYASTRWDVFQGGRDRLFPTGQVFPLLQAWAKANPKVKLHLYPDGEHDFSWYAEHAAPEIKKLF
jgi:dienelactone hydrolase